MADSLVLDSTNKLAKILANSSSNQKNRMIFTRDSNSYNLLRGRGRRNALTGQPNEGRKHGGGLRVGEMEKDSFNSHGASFVINERMMISSDAKKITICPTCKRKVNSGSKQCNICNSKTEHIMMPSAADLLIQELQSMCINVKLLV